MSEVFGTPGGDSPNQVGQFYVPQSEWNPNPLDEDFCAPPLVNSPVIQSLFLAASFLVPWAGSYDEAVTIGVPAEENAWIAPVLVTKPVYIPAFSDTDDIVAPLPPVDEDYPYNRPIQWPPQVIRLTWGSEDDLTVLSVQEEDYWLPIPPVTATTLELLVGTSAPSAAFDKVIDDSEWISPVLTPKLIPKLLNWDQADQVLSTVVDDEPWIKLGPIKWLWQSSVIDDRNGDWVLQVPVVAEEDYWIPTQPVTSTTLGLVVGNSAQSAIVPVVGALDEGTWLRLTHSIEWRARLASDPTDDAIPAVTAKAEEDYLIPIPPVTVTTLSLLGGTSAPAAVPTQVTPADEQYKLELPKLRGEWSPWLASDPTDDSIPPTTMVDEEAQLTVIPPPVIVEILAPWVFGDDNVVQIVNEDEITFSSLQVTRWKPQRVITAWRVGENEPLITALRVDEENWIPYGVPPVTLSGQRQSFSEPSEVASLAPPIKDEDYHWFTYCAVSAKLSRYDQWKNELHDIFIFVPPSPPPPPKCTTELPGGVTITVESPAIASVVVELPGGVNVNRESPSVVTLTPETPLAIDTGGEPPTDPCA